MPYDAFLDLHVCCYKLYLSDDYFLHVMKMTEIELVLYIREITQPVIYNNNKFAFDLKFISNEINESKYILQNKSIHFIVLKMFNERWKNIHINDKDFFDVYIIGDFKKVFKPTLTVAKALARFYSEIGILPNLIAVSKEILRQDKDMLDRLKNGVNIYERR